MAVTASTIVGGSGRQSPNVFKGLAAPTITNDSVAGFRPGDIFIVAPNGVFPLAMVDSSSSATFRITVEGVATGTITYSSTIATMLANINAALTATFGAGQIVASGANLASIILTFSGSNFANRPIGAVSFTLITNSAGGAALTINTVSALTLTAVTQSSAAATAYVNVSNTANYASWLQLA